MITVGTKIYYRGDRCNAAGFGTVTMRYPAGRFSAEVHIVMENGQDFTISEAMIQSEDTGNGLTRFATRAAYEAYREAYLAG
jgi:hypothetical protein